MEIDDKFRNNPMDMVANPQKVATCPRDGDVLVSTMKFPGAEFYCLTCERGFGFLAPVGKEETPELLAKIQENQDKFKELFSK